MARGFGSTGASSLIRAATAAYNKNQAFNDASASYEYDMSAKTQEDINKYNTYLSKRLEQTKTSDPTKALSLQRTATSAYRSFNSAEIGRATTSVKFGDMSSRDKYTRLQQLQQAAQSNGDDNLAQSLWGQMASLSVQIQNEDKANVAAGEASQAKALAAYKKGYARDASRLQNGIKELNAMKVAGTITPAQYNDRMSQLYLGNPKANENDPARYGLVAITQEAAKQTGDPDLTYQNKLDGWAADRQVQKYVNGTASLNGANGNAFGQVITKEADGTYSFKDRPDGDATGQQLAIDPATGKPRLDANGHAMSVPIYAGPQIKGKDGQLSSFQYATNIDGKGNIAPGTGAGALRQVDQFSYDDPSGVPYFINEAGVKKYVGAVDANGKTVDVKEIGKTPGVHPIMGNSPDVINGTIDGKKPEGAGSYDPLGFWKNAPAEFAQAKNDLAAGLSRADAKTGGMLSKLPLLGNLINKNNAAQEQVKQAAIAKAQMEAYTKKQAEDAAYLSAQRAQTAKLLPVFQPPKPAPTPAPTNQYKLPALPAPVPVAPGSKFTVPASTGNYKKDVLNLGRSLGGLM